MTDEELKQLVESNARTTQAMLDAIGEARNERRELQEGMLRLQEVMVKLQTLMERLTMVQEQMVKIESPVQRVPPSIFSNFDELSEEEELAAMANDPAIQAEIAAINREFAITEMDGLAGL